MPAVKVEWTAGKYARWNFTELQPDAINTEMKQKYVVVQFSWGLQIRTKSILKFFPVNKNSTTYSYAVGNAFQPRIVRICRIHCVL